MMYKSFIIVALYSLTLAYFGVQLALRVTIFELDRSSSFAIHQVLANHGFDSFTLPVLDGQSLLLCSSDSGCETLSLISLPTASSNSTTISSVTLAPQTTLASSLPTVSVLSSSSSSSSSSPLAASPISSATSTTSTSVATIVFATIPPTASRTSTTSTTTAASVVTTAVVGGGGKGRGGREDHFRNNMVQNADILSETCTASLEFPAYLLDNATREDVALLILQCWVFCIMIFALKCRSISGTITVFLCILLQFVWSIFRIAYVNSLQVQVNRITSATCGGLLVLPDIWTRQKMLEAPSIALSGICLICLICLAYKLHTSSYWQAEHALLETSDNRRIIIFHALLQTASFFVMLPLGLWLSDLFTGVSAHFANHVPLYKAFALIEALVLIPWLIKLWYASHWQDRYRLYPLLFTIALLYVIGLDLIFIEPTYRLVFVNWPFFGATAVLSIILCIGILLSALELYQKRIRTHGRLIISVASPFKQLGSISVPPLAHSEKRLGYSKTVQPITLATRPDSFSSSFSSSSTQWQWMTPSASSFHGTLYSPTLGSSIYSSEEAAYRGYIGARSSLTPVQTSLERQLTVKEDSPTLKTPRIRVFPPQSQDFPRNLMNVRKSEGAGNE